MKALLASAPRLFSRESRLRRLLRDRFVSLILTLRWGALRISCFIGIAAGLSGADDAGRRYLIRVAAAVQFAVFPAWFGLSVMHGFGSSQLVLERLGTFAINVAPIAIWRRSLTAHA